MIDVGRILLKEIVNMDKSSVLLPLFLSWYVDTEEYLFLPKFAFSFLQPSQVFVMFFPKYLRACTPSSLGDGVKNFRKIFVLVRNFYFGGEVYTIGVHVILK